MHLISIICLFSLSFLSFFMHLISVFSLLWIISTGGAPKRQLTYELKYMGIVDDKKWCPFFIQPSENPTFCTQKRPFSVIGGPKKWVFGRPNKKTDTTFCCQLYPKMMDETLVSYEYHYWVSFGQILKMAYFRLIFGRFPLIKSQNQNPMLPSVNF